jgi:hypothetical protein
MSKQHQYEVRLTPSQVLARLRSATVPQEVVANLSAPLRSYATFVAESVTGPKEFIARIDGQRFRLMPLGVWPFKGHHWTSPVGSLNGEVSSAAAGARVTARFKVFPAYLAFAVGWFLLVAGLGGLWLFLTAMGQQLEPLDRIMPGAVVSVLAVLGLALWEWLLLAARRQERAMAEFLSSLLRESGAESVVAADGGRDAGFPGLIVAQRGRRC